MNKHLELVFKLLLPELDREGIDYWVYGGVSIAGVLGNFYRYNKDVDIFVKDTDFKKACSVLQSICKNEILKCYLSNPDRETNRPKFEIYESKNEIFSMIPVYQEGQSVILKYPKRFGGNQKFSKDILNKEERNMSNYRFFTTQDEYVKDLFIRHMKTRTKEKLMKRSTFSQDAENLLSPLERKEIEDYYALNS